jgi:molecular chaperone DnaK (HSP70)
MKLGIDFGTNRIVVAVADRGNYPLISFESSDGNLADWYPSVVAVRGPERLYGWQAWDAQTDESWTVVRSIKRLLEDAGPGTVLDLGDQQIRLTELLNGLTGGLRRAILESSNVAVPEGEILQIILGVPAHANSNQRFLTVESFRSSGFAVLGVLNEPSAASIEFGHKQRESKSGRETILVYDLGGGTFDASLVVLDDKVHHVIASEGIPTIGGDDFDHILAQMALEAAGISEAQIDSISPSAWFRLLEECRTKKESLNPNSRKLVIDFENVNPAWNSATVPVAEFYELARPLVEETLAAAEDLLATREGQFEALYITGGGSELPLVARVLRERFGRRVRRSAYTRSATAIGLAIQADQPDAYQLSERLARFFGVWREADAGTKIVFDPLFAKGIQLPAAGQPALAIRRTYHPVHNIGHFRFLECSHCASDGTPSGEITLWDEIYFPFDPAHESDNHLNLVQVDYSHAANRQRIEELYECDSSGAITVTISNKCNGFTKSFRLGRWSTDSKPMKPTKRRAKAR